MDLSIDAYSCKGMRKENQDAYWASEIEINGKKEYILLICDGMGGSDNGLMASTRAVKTIKNTVLRGLIDIKSIESACLKLHRQLISEGGKSGTTVTYLSTDGKKYRLFHVGDSRCYKITENGYEMISEDHTVAADARRGLYGAKSQQYLNYPSNVLSRCIGMGAEPRAFKQEGVFDCNGFLLCSDGFWHTLTDQDDLKDLETAAETAIFRGENDNVTILKIKKS